jgi:ATP-dependent Clp protease ATP-binding subunit ClpA
MSLFGEFWKTLTASSQQGTGDGVQWDKFTPRAQEALRLAREEAARLQQAFVGTEHALLGLIRLGQGCGYNVLCAMGVNLDNVRIEVERMTGLGPADKTREPIPFTPRVKKVLALADKERSALGHKYLGTEHILLGLLREGDGVAGRVLKRLGLDLEITRQTILKELDPNYIPPPADAATSQKSESELALSNNIDLSKRYDVYCREGTEEVVYRNALFRGGDELFHKRAQFVALELSDGKIIFVASSSIVKFHEHVPSH